MRERTTADLRAVLRIPSETGVDRSTPEVSGRRERRKEQAHRKAQMNDGTRMCPA